MIIPSGLALHRYEPKLDNSYLSTSITQFRTGPFTKNAKVWLVGPGGGGAGADNTTNRTPDDFGGGGGGGASVYKRLTALDWTGLSTLVNVGHSPGAAGSQGWGRNNPRKPATPASAPATLSIPAKGLNLNAPGGNGGQTSAAGGGGGAAGTGGDAGVAGGNGGNGGNGNGTGGAGGSINGTHGGNGAGNVPADFQGMNAGLAKFGSSLNGIGRGGTGAANAGGGGGGQPGGGGGGASGQRGPGTVGGSGGDSWFMWITDGIMV